MKKIFLTIFIMASLCAQLLYSTCRTSQTFMFYRPLSHKTAAVDQAWYSIIAHKDYAHSSALQFMSIYQHTLQDNLVAGYFLLNCKKNILVAGDNTPFVHTRDVRAEWLHLPDHFIGQLTLAPAQQQMGGIICYNKDLGNLHAFLKNWWCDIRIPVYQVKNNLGLHASPELSQAMAQFIFARMDHQTRRSTGMSALELGLGVTFLDHDNGTALVSAALSIPTSKRATPEVIFSPFLSNNGHCVMRFSFYTEVPLCHHDTALIPLFFLGIDNYYYFKNHQLRTFDLINKPWSRYLIARNIKTGELTSAVTILTLPVSVHPHNFVDLVAGLKFQRNSFEFEIGYNLWAHGSEKLFLSGPSCDKVMPEITHWGINGTDGGTAEHSTIAELAPNDIQPTHLVLNDIDLLSGAARGGHTNTFHGACAYNYQQASYLITVGIGVFYEKPSSNAALENYGAWFKIISSF